MPGEIYPPLEDTRQNKNIIKPLKITKKAFLVLSAEKNNLSREQNILDWEKKDLNGEVNILNDEEKDLTLEENNLNDEEKNLAVEQNILNNEVKDLSREENILDREHYFLKQKPSDATSEDLKAVKIQVPSGVSPVGICRVKIYPPLEDTRHERKFHSSIFLILLQSYYNL